MTALYYKHEKGNSVRTIENCRVCESPNLEEVLNLGLQRVSDFREDDSKTNAYPLVAVLCDDCLLVQLKDTTPQGEMYHENYGFKSGVSDSIKADLKDNVEHALKFKESPRSWLDIASNDGTLLSYVPKEAHRTGVDPITKLCAEAEEHADEIVNEFFVGGTLDGQKFDVVTSISCFYDMDDPNDFVSGVKNVMEDDGIWVIQQNYLLPTMELNAVDNFCHEHLEYYTLASLENLLDRHELEVIDLKTTMVNGGSIRTVVANKGKFPTRDSVEQQRSIEADAGLLTPERYRTFGGAVLQQMEELKDVVDKYNEDGKTVYILAASTRGATIWQGAGITEEDVPFAVERNPAKVGRYFSAVGMPIISEEQARADKPDAMLVGPWFFSDEIVEREREYIEAGGELIIPLPEIVTVNKDNIDEYLEG